MASFAAIMAAQQAEKSVRDAEARELAELRALGLLYDAEEAARASPAPAAAPAPAPAPSPAPARAWGASARSIRSVLAGEAASVATPPPTSAADVATELAAVTTATAPDRAASPAVAPAADEAPSSEGAPSAEPSEADDYALAMALWEEEERLAEAARVASLQRANPSSKIRSAPAWRPSTGPSWTAPAGLAVGFTVPSAVPDKTTHADGTGTGFSELAHATEEWELFEEEVEYASTRGTTAKHDARIGGRRNVRELERQFSRETGDLASVRGASGDRLQLSNSVANDLRRYLSKQTNKGQATAGRVEQSTVATAEGVLDASTRLILFRLLANGFLDRVNGVVRTGKEAAVYRGQGWHDVVGERWAADLSTSRVLATIETEDASSLGTGATGDDTRVHHAHDDDNEDDEEGRHDAADLLRREEEEEVEEGEDGEVREEDGSGEGEGEGEGDEEGIAPMTEIPVVPRDRKRKQKKTRPGRAAAAAAVAAASSSDATAGSYEEEEEADLRDGAAHEVGGVRLPSRSDRTAWSELEARLKFARLSLSDPADAAAAGGDGVVDELAEAAKAASTKSKKTSRVARADRDAEGSEAREDAEGAGDDGNAENAENEEEDEEKDGEEVAVKVFRTTLGDFKNRSEYMNGDFRFRRLKLSRQNPRKVVRQWAEKEFANLYRIFRAGLPCPRPRLLRGNVLVMDFLGRHGVAAPQLKEVRGLRPKQWRRAYAQVVSILHGLYTRCRLVHADLSEFNLLWHQDRVWVIDVGQSVEVSHPNAERFLRADCANVTRFFERKRVPTLHADALFDLVTDTSLESVFRPKPRLASPGGRILLPTATFAAAVTAARVEALEAAHAAHAADDADESYEDVGPAVAARPRATHATATATATTSASGPEEEEGDGAVGGAGSLAHAREAAAQAKEAARVAAIEEARAAAEADVRIGGPKDPVARRLRRLLASLLDGADEDKEGEEEEVEGGVEEEEGDDSHVSAPTSAAAAAPSASARPSSSSSSMASSSSSASSPVASPSIGDSRPRASRRDGGVSEDLRVDLGPPVTRGPRKGRMDAASDEDATAAERRRESVRDDDEAGKDEWVEVSRARRG